MKDLNSDERGQLRQLVELIDRVKKFYDDVTPQIGKLCIQDYQNVNELGIILNRIGAQPEVQPVFSGDLGVRVLDDKIDANLTLWQTARARVIEKINIANKGDNGFKFDGNNYHIYLERNHENKSFKHLHLGCARGQGAEPMLYIRTKEAAQELLKNLEFCEDMRTYFKGWV